MLNLHPLTNSKAQLNIRKLNYSKFNNIARLYQRRHRGDGKAMADRLLQTGKF